MRSSESEKASKQRKEVLNLVEEFTCSVREFLAPRSMIKGSIYINKRKCGNPNCKCAQGELHSSKALSLSHHGKTKLIHLTKYHPAEIPNIEKQVKNYQNFRKARIKIIKCFEQFPKKLNRLERSLLTGLPETKIKKGGNKNGRKKRGR